MSWAGSCGASTVTTSWPKIGYSKAATCLKKCFFETYRFSEDLDFTLTDSSHVDATFLQTVFAEIGEYIYEESGIELPTDFQKFEVYTNPRGLTSCQGRIGYQGPISPRGKNMPRIKLDPDRG